MLWCSFLVAHQVLYGTYVCSKRVFEASYNSVLHVCSAAQLMIMQQRIPSVSLEALARSRALGQSLAIIRYGTLGQLQ